MSNEELKLQDPRCRIQCPGHPARKYWKLLYNAQSCRIQDVGYNVQDILPENTGSCCTMHKAAGSTMSDTMSRTSGPKILDI